MMDLGGAPDMGIPAGMLQIGRWVLYDKDAMFVKAVASPQPYQGTAKVDFGTYEFSCVYINFWDSDFIGMTFDLISGSPKPCMKNSPSWKELTPSGGYFKDANCTQPVAPLMPGYPPSVYQIGGAFYYATTNTPAVGTLYIWSSAQNTCTLLDLAGYSIHEYKPVPNWVLEIMDSPPYSMVLEY